MTLRVACLGAGFFSQFHRDGWDRIKEADLVAIADHDLAKAASTGNQAFDDLEKMLNATRPDILDIITPSNTHARAIETAVEHNLKAIICQKPFCNSLEEARAVVELANAKGVCLIIHENFRFQPWFRAIKTAMTDGEIGIPVQATFRLRPGDGQGPDAYLARQPYFQKMPRFLIHETGVHYIDVFRFLFGNPTAVYADLRKINPVISGEDAGFVIFDHPNGVRCLLDGNRNLDHPATNLRCTMGEGLFEGTDGTLTLFGDGSVQLRKFGYQKSKILLTSNHSGTFGGDCTFHLQSHVVNTILNSGSFENSGEDYISVIEAEGAIYESAMKLRKIDLDPNA